jgi:crotonobetainyl-CoA:carnitine CoA-transferase CaiB-like acyl-CoA transferase
VHTGQGEHVEISLFDSISDWMAVPLLQAKYAKAPERVGLRHPSIAPYGAYTCADGVPVLLAIQNEREWIALCTRVLSNPGLAADVHYGDNTARVKNRQLLDSIIEPTLGALVSTEVCRRLDDADIAYGVINELDAVLRDPRLRTFQVETSAGKVSVPLPATLRASAAETLGAVPELDQQGPAIRREFEFSSADGNASVA